MIRNKLGPHLFFHSAMMFIFITAHLLITKNIYPGLFSSHFKILILITAASITLASGYTLLMNTKFFLPKTPRRYLTTYLLTHTVMGIFVSLMIFIFLSQKSFIEVIKIPNFFFFSLATWPILNIFEFGRKAFAATEEIPSVETYSSLFGKVGTVTLIISQALIADALLLNLYGTNLDILLLGMGVILIFLIGVSTLYISSDKPSAAKLFRLYSFSYLILIYLIMISAFLITEGKT